MNNKKYLSTLDINSQEFRKALTNLSRLDKSRKDLEDIKLMKAVYPAGHEFWKTPETRLKIDLMFHYPRDIPHDILNIPWPNFKTCKKFRILAKVKGERKFINVNWKSEQIEQFLYRFGEEEIIWYAIEGLLENGNYLFVKFWDRYTSKNAYDKLLRLAFWKIYIEIFSIQIFFFCKAISVIQADEHSSWFLER